MEAVLRSLAADTFAGFTLEERVLLQRLLRQVHENVVCVTQQTSPVMS